ncbi:MAG: ATP-binding protein [candidate division Zixibacteria bacterium]|nr:ATP-binding protein [candidate division Zixibacteria bacterium]
MSTETLQVQRAKGESIKKFDLNVEKVLEDWEAHHAIREVIANALDEQLLTRSRDIQITQDSKGDWRIRDFGRGLKYQHLTQKENEEKLKNEHLIGKFGVGLKDALATFDRRNIKVFIKSPHGDITLGKSQKHDFEDIVTLHAYVSSPSESSFTGTEFVLEGCKKEDIEKAKSLFLKFSGEKVLEKTQYGEVLEKKSNPAKIYINGVKVAEEENFLFSYNVTSLTKAIKKALNRERSNVGRTAYSDRIKAILLACKGKDVAEKLVADSQKYETGLIHDELKWADISIHAYKLLSSSEKVLLITPRERTDAANMVDRAKEDGLRIITIPENIREMIKGQKDFSGNPIRDLGQFTNEWNESFEFKFVDAKGLSREERKVFEKTEAILNLIGGKPKKIKKIKISETMRMENFGFKEASGLWEEDSGRVIIKRAQLRTLKDYAGTLLHEVAHAISGASDISSEFEEELTSLLGTIASKTLK